MRCALLILCGFAALIMAAPVQAASDSAAATPASIAFECKGQLPKKTLEETLAKVQTEYQKLSAVSADFDQDSYLAALNTAESSSGKVIFSKPGRMKWSYEDPEVQEFVLRDHTVWLYQPEIKQVLIDELTQVLLTDLPVAFLMGVGNLKEGFTLHGGCKSSLGTVLLLDPKTAAKEGEEGNSLKSFKLLVTHDGLPAGAQVLDLVGNVTTIALKGMKENPAVTDAQFTVEYPKGTDVNDRRVRKEG